MIFANFLQQLCVFLENQCKYRIILVKQKEHFVSTFTIYSLIFLAKTFQKHRIESPLGILLFLFLCSLFCKFTSANRLGRGAAVGRPATSSEVQQSPSRHRKVFPGKSTHRKKHQIRREEHGAFRRDGSVTQLDTHLELYVDLEKIGI
jgi:hypothetical protein